MSIIRNDYKNGPDVRPEQTRWEEVVFGSPEATRLFRAQTPARRFVQVAAEVLASGRFVSNENIRLHMMWDRKRTTHFKSVRGEARPIETIGWTGLAEVGSGGSISVRSDVPGGSWFDFSNRPYSGGQSCRSVSMRKEEFLPDWYTGKSIAVKISTDNKNVDIIDCSQYNNVIFRLVGPDVLMPGNPAVELPFVSSHGVDPREFNLGEVYKFTVDRSIPIARTNRPTKWLVTDWDDVESRPKPKMYGPTSKDRSTLDLRFDDNRKRVSVMCDIYEHMNRVTLGKGLGIQSMATPDDWMPTPYYGFRSMTMFDAALADPNLVATQEMVELFRLDSAASGLLPVHRFRDVGKIVSATKTVGNQIRLGFENGQSNVLPEMERYVLMSKSGVTYVLANLSDFHDRFIAADDVVAVEVAPEYFVDATSMENYLGKGVVRNLVQTKLRESLVSALSVLALPASLAHSMPNLVAGTTGKPHLIWDVSSLRGEDENGVPAAGVYMAPPVYVDCEVPQEFYLGSAAFFNGIPTEYRVFKGLIPDKKKLEKEAAAEEARRAKREERKAARATLKQLTTPDEGAVQSAPSEPETASQEG